jgi:hypothetical protein
MAAFITMPITDEAACYLTRDDDAGFAVTEDRELVGVFNAADEQRGDELISTAVEYGAERLNCFDTELVSLYERHGFETVERIKWNEEYAPDDWDYERFGRPDVVIMEVTNE